MLGLLVGGVSRAAAQRVGQVGPSAALGQLGTVNPSNPVFIFRPSPTGPFVVVPSGFPFSRETVPFGDEPHSLNNAHPMLPNAGDRKSTRLNSSHDQISYAVFCLKKQNFYC